jgi:nitrite reductase (NO-forming)
MAHTITDRAGSSSGDEFPTDLREQIESLSERESRLEGKVERRDNATVLVYIAAVVALLLGIVGVGFGARALDESRDGGSTGAAGASNAPSTVSVELTEFAISPAAIDIAAGGTIEVTNNGAVPHDFAIVGTDLATKMLNPGESDTLELGDLAPGEYATLCQVAGHDAAGMVGTITVGGGGTASAASTDHGAAPAAAATGAVIDANATPGPEWKAFDPTLKPAPGGTVHEIAISAAETVLEVAPGVTQEMWTFNGQVPGPVLRGKVGDVFNVTLTNDGKVGHSIDFHASEVAPNIEMRTLASGESLVYQFKAEFAGMWMYHCGTAPALHHIGNGMFGAVIIDPVDLAPVDKEFVMVQSEMYLGPEGKPGDLNKMVAEQHDAVVFNGYYNQYKFSPIHVQPGERVRVWVLDAGPSENSSFHIVGTIFDTVYKEGAYVLRPNNSSRGGAQALDLQAAQGGFVEFTLDREGTYPMVTHKFANVGKGALGLFQAGGASGSMDH